MRWRSAMAVWLACVTSSGAADLATWQADDAAKVKLSDENATIAGEKWTFLRSPDEHGEVEVSARVRIDAPATTASRPPCSCVQAPTAA